MKFHGFIAAVPSDWPSSRRSIREILPLSSIASSWIAKLGSTLAPGSGARNFTVGGVWFVPAPNRSMITAYEFCVSDPPVQRHEWFWVSAPSQLSPVLGALPFTQSLPHCATTFWKKRRPSKGAYVIGSAATITWSMLFHT